MPTTINFKICDNSADCNGITMCPAGVFAWDDEKKTITLDSSKCIECGACANFCTVNAIRYAKSQEELEKIQKEIDSDPRTISELFVERYGAAPIDDTYTFELSAEKVKNRINSNRPVIIEFNRWETVNCLLKSVPIADIQKQFNANATYSKFFVEDKDMPKFDIKETPVLKFYYKNELLGQIDGYFERDDRFEHMDKIRKFGKKVTG